MNNTKENELIPKIKQITLVGYYGRDNIGDDLMLESILTFLNNHKVKVIVISFNKVDWLEEYDNVVNVIWPAKRKDKITFFLKNIYHSDAIMWGGGTCFTDEDGDGFFKYMVLAKLIRKKIIYYGVGLGNLTRLSRAIKTFILINLSDLITLRDDFSFEKVRKRKLIKQDSVLKVEDPANQLIKNYKNDNMYHHLIDGSQNTLVISWRNLSKYKKTTIGNELGVVASFCLRVINEKKIKRVVFINADSYFDQKTNLLLFKDLQKKVKNEYNNTELIFNDTKCYKEKLKVLLNSDYIITARLHVAIAAHIFEREFYVYNYSPKIEYFMKNIKKDSFNLIPKNFNIEEIKI